MESVWISVLRSAWDAYVAQTLPIGAAVVADDGAVLSEGRSRRHDSSGPPGQLANSRIAHAEVNALAALPAAGAYSSVSLYANVEPCCLCMGAAVQTGVGAVHFAWADAYGGASCMLVDNVQARRRSMAIHGPGPSEVSLITAVLVACHYVLVRPEHVYAVDAWTAVDAHFLTRVTETGLTATISAVAAASAPAEAAFQEILNRAG